MKKKIVDAPIANVDKSYEEENDHRKVMDAMEVLMDPVKMKAVHKIAGRKKKAISSLKDLHNILNEKFGKEAAEEASED